MNWLNDRKLKKRFESLVENAKPMVFNIDPSFKATLQGEHGNIDINGLSIEANLQCHINFKDSWLPFTIFIEVALLDYNGDMITLKKSRNIARYELDNFDSECAILKNNMNDEILNFYDHYKLGKGFLIDYYRIKALNIENCLHRNLNNGKILNTWIYCDFKRAMLYFQSLEKESLQYLEEYKKYIFKKFKEKIYDDTNKNHRVYNTIKANEPLAKFYNYEYWLYQHKKDLDEQALENEIESRVENIAKLLEEVNA